MLAAIAVGLGRMIRVFWLAVGPCLIVYGIDLISRPAAFIAAGLFITAFHVKQKPSEGRK